MLALARELRGLTQLELSQKLPTLNQGNYSKIEKGLMPLNGEMLKNISEVLDLPLSFFYKKAPNSQLSDFYYRKRISMPMKELTPLEAKFKLISFWVDELLDSVSLPEFKIPPIQVSDAISAEDISRKIRQFLNIPPGPIGNIVRIMEAAGIIIYFVKKAPEKFDGISLLTDIGQPIIFLNENISNDRKRFTLAHELGHLIMHIRYDWNEDLDKVEKEADVFASEFLMPYLDCRGDLLNLQFKNLGTLKSYWKVSKAAITYKAYKIGYLTPSRYKTFMIELSRSGERKTESDFVDIDAPVLIDKVINAHLNQLHYSREELLNVLSINENDFEEIFLKSGANRPPKLSVVV